MSVEHERRAAAAAAPADPAGADPGSLAATPASRPEQPAPAAVVVIALPPPTAAAKPPANRPSGAPQRDMHVASDLHDLVAATPLAAPQEDRRAKEQRDLNEIVHGVLIIGLLISTALMLVGVALALIYGRDLPTAVPDIGEVIRRVIALRPSGFLALGLLALIATPIVRVVGSIGAFLYERDWRYAAITCLVLAVLMVSLLLGRG